MLLDYVSVYGQFDYRRIVRLHSYNIANDKAYALSGIQTYEFLNCAELSHPRISKNEIKTSSSEEVRTCSALNDVLTQ